MSKTVEEVAMTTPSPMAENNDDSPRSEEEQAELPAVPSSPASVVTSESSSSSSASPLTITPWAEALQSPEEPVYSPGRPLVVPKAPLSTTTPPLGHGWALLVATERARTLARSSSRAVTLLVDVTQLYDHHAQALLKAGQALNSIIGHQQVPEAVKAQQSLVFWSGETSKFSRLLRTEIAQPLKCRLESIGESVQALQEKYHLCRQKAVSIRQRAIRAEQAMQHTELPKPEKAILVRQGAVYKRLVDWENHCVEQCQRLEVMALESLQKLEHDRLQLSVNSLVQAIRAQKLAHVEVMQSMQQTTIEPHHRQELFGKLRRSSLAGSITFDEGAGRMEAETLGLPVALGQLRDIVRSRMANRSTRLKIFRLLAGFLDYVAVALEKLSSGLQQHVLGSPALPQEASPIVDLWERLVGTLRVEADQATHCATQLRSITHDMNDRILQGEQHLSFASEAETYAWKQLCDACRIKNKAEERFMQTCDDKLKARRRFPSTESISEHQSPPRVTSHVSRSLANMFSVLPNGGEHAMKMLSSETVASIVQHNLEDADEKASKSRQSLDTMLARMSRLEETYKSTGKTFMAENEEDDLTFSPFQSLLSMIESSRATILASMEDWEDTTPVESEATVAAVMNQWVSEAQERRLSAASNAVDTTGLYKLTAKLVPPVAGLLSEENEASIDEELEAAEEEFEETAMNEYPDEGGRFTANSWDGALFGADLFGINGGSHDEDESSLHEPSMSNLDDDDRAVTNNKWLGLSNSMSDSFRKQLTFRRPNRRRYRRFLNVSTETELFATYFWPDKVDPKKIPSVIDSFACSMVEGATAQYGRVFVSSVRLTFVSWTGKKKLSLKHAEEITCVDPALNPWNQSDDALKVTYKKGPDGESTTLWLGGFFDRQQAIDLLTQTREKATKSRAEELKKIEELAAQQVENGNEPDKLTNKSVPPGSSVPPDNTLSKMEIVISRNLRNISIERFYELVWSEGINTTENPLYRPFLEESNLDVEVGDWEFVDFVGPWDQERYQQKRSVKFRVKRKTHLYIGPPIADVQQVSLKSLASFLLNVPARTQ
jgi:hypothetical protein